PTYGLVSRSGVVAMGSSLDVIGPLARSVEDAAIVLDVMAGKDGLDSTMIDRQDDYTDLTADVKGKKVGVIREHMGEGMDPNITKMISDTVQKLEAAGAEVTELSLPSLPMALAVYYILCPAEVSSNLGRYDGQRYGYTDKDAKDLDASY